MEKVYFTLHTTGEIALDVLEKIDAAAADFEQCVQSLLKDTSQTPSDVISRDLRSSQPSRFTR